MPTWILSGELIELLVSAVYVRWCGMTALAVRYISKWGHTSLQGLAFNIGFSLNKLCAMKQRTAKWLQTYGAKAIKKRKKEMF